MNCKICGAARCELIRDGHSLVSYGIKEDMDGYFHSHDENYRFQTWKCCNGHEFKCAAFNVCWCGWTSKYPDKCEFEFKKQPETKRCKFESKCFIMCDDAKINLRIPEKHL